MKRILFYIILSTLLLPLVLVAQDAASWRAPTDGDLGKHSEWRKDDPHHYLLVKADFDGDGKEDIARLVINDKENKMGLLVTLSASDNPEPLLLETINDKRWIEVIGITIAKPGTYGTACGKGYYDCGKGEPEHIRLDRPGIDFFKYESANMYFLWNIGKKKFDRIYMSD
jgi:hypothetical protein